MKLTFLWEWMRKKDEAKKKWSLRESFVFYEGSSNFLRLLAQVKMVYVFQNGNQTQTYRCGSHVGAQTAPCLSLPPSLPKAHAWVVWVTAKLIFYFARSYFWFFYYCYLLWQVEENVNRNFLLMVISAAQDTAIHIFGAARRAESAWRELVRQTAAIAFA